MQSVATRFALIGLVVLAMTAQAAGQDLQQKAAAAKQAAAQNQKALRGYAWLEKVELSFKGELKSTKVSSCRYGPDGQVQKTPVVEPPPPEKKGGLRGRAIAKKTGEMKAELEAAAALVHQYVPPSPDRIQAVANAGGVSLAQAGPGMVSLKFAGYEKAGDSLALTFEQAIKSLKRIDVTTWLEKPSEPVTLQVAMQSLPDGTDYPGAITLAIPSSQIEVRITNINYQKVVP
jgi:hypothetical protein